MFYMSYCLILKYQIANISDFVVKVTNKMTGKIDICSQKQAVIPHIMICIVVISE